MASAPRVVGPFAASTISLHWNLSALLILIDCSNAAGIKMSLNKYNYTTHGK